MPREGVVATIRVRVGSGGIDVVVDIVCLGRQVEMERLEISGIQQFVCTDDVLNFIYFDCYSKNLWIFPIFKSLAISIKLHSLSF